MTKQIGLSMLSLSAIIIPFIIPTYYTHILIIVLMWVTLASAWNLLGGYAGCVSFGHAFFFGIGAYGGGVLYHHWGISPWYGMVVGPVAAVLLSIPIGWITFRLRGPYFALGMLAVAEITRILFINMKDVTNGAVGIMISRTWGGQKVQYYFIILGISILTIGTIYVLLHSKLGYYFLSIREDQDAAEALGIPTTRYKVYALIPSAFFTGLGGAFYMNYMAYIEPSVVFSLEGISIMVILCVMLGGAGTFWGPSVGAMFYVVLAELFRIIPIIKNAHVLIFALIVIGVIMFSPEGVLGEWDKFRSLFRRKEIA